MSVSPFDWLEASYFYYRPNDLIWEGNQVRGHFLDKGFNIKFVYRSRNEVIPNIAIGFDDFAGTGYFTREYLIASKNIGSFSSTIGLGWGKYAGENSFDNPLTKLKDSLSIRPVYSDNFKSGGSPSYDQWFRGDAAIFGGVEYSVPNIKGLNLKLEYDPFNYFDFSANNRSDADKNLRKKDSKINFGISYLINKYVALDASYIKGNTLNVSLTISHTFGEDSPKKPKFNPNIQVHNNQKSNKNDIFYEDLLLNLNKNKLLLQTATLHDNGDLDVSISTSEHRNAIRSSSYAAFISQEVSKNNNLKLGRINISHINAGIELNNISYIANYFNEDNVAPIEITIRNTYFDSGDPNGYLEDEFKPKIKFPVVFSSLSPVIISHIGNPEKFYFGGINLQHVSEIQFNRNLLLSSELNSRIYGNFKNTISGSGSKMQHVRTDLVEYLKEDDLYVSRMQLDYIWSPYKDIYTKLSGGIFEPMYGGFGGEFLYKPFNKNFDIGIELFYVKQRAYDQRFNFQKYETVTGHVNLGYKFFDGIETNLSFGRYLAKDDGFTLDIGRRTHLGFKSGIYFTRTNVSAETFGEGSFDKGFYFQIPFDLFSGEYKGTYSSIKVSPLTRDGGAKLIHDKDLKGLIYNSTYYELNKQWNGYMH